MLMMEWYHVVEQCQIKKSGFDVHMIQNEKNIVSITKGVHRKISGDYSRILPNTNGLRVREWLVGQSYETQYEVGMDVIKMFME